jgi:uncharacterized protein DUF6510
MSHLDGNAIGGVLGEVFGLELTTALSTCDGCGKHDVVAELAVYVRCPGIVVRCPACDNVLMRIVRTPERYVLDLRGMRTFEL